MLNSETENYDLHETQRLLDIMGVIFNDKLEDDSDTQNMLFTLLWVIKGKVGTASKWMDELEAKLATNAKLAA